MKPASGRAEGGGAEPHWEALLITLLHLLCLKAGGSRMRRRRDRAWGGLKRSTLQDSLGTPQGPAKTRQDPSRSHSGHSQNRPQPTPAVNAK
eukprot:7492083-Alexandrium_andersonii.AAC.1